MGTDPIRTLPGRLSVASEVAPPGQPPAPKP
jgi:hypothetical protein